MSDELKVQLVRLVSGAVVAYLTMKTFQHMMKDLKPGNDRQRQAAESAKLKFDRLGIRLDEINLNGHEMELANLVVDPATIQVRWSDSAGLDKEIQLIKETVILPIKRWELFQQSNSKLISVPKGVLFSGPPGVGKTMLAKAIAKESGCIFINVQVSILFDMYYGESQKYTQAIFSLANKLNVFGPVIIFIDEIDSLLRSRSAGDHESTQLMKAAFMSLWDGLITSKESRIVLMGATNRPQSIDPAILRRMPIKLKIGLPNPAQRQAIITNLLADDEVSPDVDIARLASLTEGMSGSDLKDWCCASSMARYRELFREEASNESAHDTYTDTVEHQAYTDTVLEHQATVRPIRMSDFTKGMTNRTTNGATADHPIELD